MRKALVILCALGLLLGGCQVVTVQPVLDLTVSPEEGEGPLLVQVELRSNPPVQACSLRVGELSAQGTGATFLLATPGVHTVEATGFDYRGRPFRLERTVHVWDRPTIVSFEAEVDGKNVLFAIKAEAEYVPLTAVEVDPGLGYSLLVRIPELLSWEGVLPFSYPQTGSYTATLRVTNAQGLSVQSTLPLVIEESSEEEEPPA